MVVLLAHFVDPAVDRLIGRLPAWLLPWAAGVLLVLFVLDTDVYKRQVKKLDVHFAIQTNGTLIDREWAGFLAQNGFLTGLSLDGTKEVNDRFRVDAQGGGTYTKVLHAAQLFDTAGAQYNILTTVTSAVAENVERIYRFFKKDVYKRQILTWRFYMPQSAALPIRPPVRKSLSPCMKRAQTLSSTSLVVLASACSMPQ